MEVERKEKGGIEIAKRVAVFLEFDVSESRSSVVEASLQSTCTVPHPHLNQVEDGQAQVESRSKSNFPVEATHSNSRFQLVV